MRYVRGLLEVEYKKPPEESSIKYMGSTIHKRFSKLPDPVNNTTRSCSPPSLSVKSRSIGSLFPPPPQPPPPLESNPAPRSLIGDVLGAVVRLVLAVHDLQVGRALLDELGARLVLQVAGPQERVAEVVEGVVVGDLEGQLAAHVGDGRGRPALDAVEVLEVLYREGVRKVSWAVR